MSDFSKPATSFNLGQKTFEYITDVEWFEGPWASLFLEKKSREIYFLHWVDRTDTFHRWLFFPVSPHSLRLYLEGKLSDEDLIWLDPSEKIILLELNGDMKVGAVREFPKKDIPADYLPSSQAFFDESLCPDLEKIKRFLEKFPVSSSRKLSNLGMQQSLAA